jgi:hypothetical protein
MINKTNIYLAVMFVLVASVSFAVVLISKEGIWPDTWPKELEKFRKQSQSYDFGFPKSERWHDIPFQKREQFEEAWPHILKLKTKGAPLIIENTQSSHGRYTNILKVGIPGVRILCSMPDAATFYSELTQETRLTPWRETWPTPWPDYINLPSGGLPEYVVFQDGKWVAADIKQFTG